MKTDKVIKEMVERIFKFEKVSATDFISHLVTANASYGVCEEPEDFAILNLPNEH